MTKKKTTKKRTAKRAAAEPLNIYYPWMKSMAIFMY